MADYCCVIRFSSVAPDYIELVFSAIIDVGASIRNPYNDKITSWSDSGGWVELSSYEEVVSQAIAGEITNVQFWVGVGDDILLSWESLASSSSFSISLNGMADGLLESVIRALAMLSWSNRDQASYGMPFFEVRKD